MHHRCGQPGQQHGRRTPSFSSEHTLSTCCRLVSSFLTEMVQQIHSLRASGVISSEAASAFASDASPCRRAAGSLCTTPPEIRTVAIEPPRRLPVSDTRVQLGFRDHCGRSVHNNRMEGDWLGARQQRQLEARLCLEFGCSHPCGMLAGRRRAVDW